MKRVNTINPISIADEDCKAMRSDEGNKMTEQLHHTTTTAKQKQTKKNNCLQIQI